MRENWRFFERKEEMTAQQEKERYDKVFEEKELWRNKVTEQKVLFKEELRLRDAIIQKQNASAAKMQDEIKYVKNLLTSPRML